MKVQTASIKYIVRNYEKNTDIKLGKVPRGMEIDSCNVNTLQMTQSVAGNKMIRVDDKGNMIFNGAVHKSKIIYLLSVYVGFVEKESK